MANALAAWFRIALWKRIVGAMVLGAIAGLVWGPGAENILWIGDLFIRLIRMLIVPIVFFTVVNGVVSMGDPAKLGSLGAKTLLLFLATTVAAISIGVAMAIVMQPGVGADLSNAVPGAVQEAMPIAERLMSIVPVNPIAALAEGNILAIIFFALLLGIGLITVGESARPVADLLEVGVAVVLRITGWVLEIAPFGVFALIAWVAGTLGVAAFLDVVPVAVALIIGTIIHMIVVYGALIMRFLLKLSPLMFIRGIREALLVAFSTSSSSSTLPVSLTVAETNLGVRPVVASTVLPVGATVNMDGTATYVGIVSIFGAQVFGIDLSAADYVLIVFTGALVSIATPTVPSGSLFLMAVVMETIGLAPEQIAIVVGFILAFDRPLDMWRTLVNVTGDLAVATAVAKWEDEFDQQTFERPSAGGVMDNTA